jgi:hypothetical protein
MLIKVILMGKLFTKLTLWLNFPAAVLLGATLFNPIHLAQTHHYMIAAMSNSADRSMDQLFQRQQELIKGQNASDRQQTTNTIRLQNLERRLDLLEAVRIDARISELKATIDYDHALLMPIGGAVLVMLITTLISSFKKNRKPEGGDA